MLSWLKRPAPRESRLAALLADYPAWAPPHVGSNGAAPIPGWPVLDLEQARENLGAYREAMPARLVLLGDLLSQFGIDLRMAYDQPEAFVERLHATLLQELPPLYRAELGTTAAREVSSRAGADIVLSFMADLAMLEVDVLLRAKPGCFLGLDLNPQDREMLYWRRPCVLGLVDRLFPKVAYVHCPEQDWFGIYGNMDHPGRLSAADRVSPDTWGMVIGGTILQRLDRDMVDPDLAGRRAGGWMRDAG